MGRFTRKIPEGDNLERLVCGDCGYVQYDNPKIICGVVPTFEDRILLCTRAIDPRAGYWTVPAGFLEIGETPEEGAARETQEEACADVEVGDLIGVYTIRHIAQVQLFFRGVLRSKDISPGPESQEVRLVGWNDIPWQELAFPTIRWALQDYQKNIGRQVATPGSRVVE
jgi:ADP-ribose pyrophosphatase YjhB (NUDIX family)